jgi:predicted enzyme related to lactoylglutathione lyase
MVVLYVHDMGRAVAFYRDAVGLSVAALSPGWSMLSCGEAFVGLHQIHRGVTESTVQHAGLNLQVDDLDAAIARATAGGARLCEIREPEPGVPVRLGVLVDTEGNVFELRQQ